MDALEELIEVLPLAIGIADRDGAILSFNPRFTQVFGYTTEEIPTLEAWWNTAYPDPDYRREVVAGWGRAVENALRDGTPVRGDEYRVTCRDGRERPVRISGSTVHGRVYAVFDDLSDTRAAEQSYREQLEFSRAVIASAADGICVCHEVEEFPFVRFTVWSDRMIEISGYTMDEINATGWYQTLYPDDETREMASARMNRMREGDNLRAEPWSICRKGGDALDVAISTSIVPSTDGKVHVLGIIHDRTEEVRADEERRAFEQKVWGAQRLESLGVLAGGVAHDFNNLLVAILGHAELAAQLTSRGSAIGEKLEAIATAALRASELTNQLLAYSGKGRFVVEPTDLNQLIVEMGKLIATTVPKSVALSFELSPELPHVVADAAQMRQVVMNLITNAAEAITASSGHVRVRTRSASLGAGETRHGVGELAIGPGDYAVLSVDDDGQGMSEEALEHIFDPFYTTKFTGRGLGLAAVLGIVRGHEGSLCVRSTVGEGSSFELWLPTRGAAGAGAPEPLERESGEVSAARALIVDDEPAVRQTMMHLVESLGMEAIIAADGLEALRLFETQGDAIDIVILDLTMPRKSGEETLRALRTQRPELPVVLVSGYSADEMQTRFGDLERTAFLQKPFRLVTLTSAIQAVLSKESPHHGAIDPGPTPR